MESQQISQEKKEELKEIYNSLNPAELKRAIDRKLEELWELYRKKKGCSSANPYKKQSSTMVTF